MAHVYNYLYLYRNNIHETVYFDFQKHNTPQHVVRPGEKDQILKNKCDDFMKDVTNFMIYLDEDKENSTVSTTSKKQNISIEPVCLISEL